MPELFPYQRDGVKFLASRLNACLFDQPGLGKTAQAICAWRTIGARKVLVICPASVRNVWRREIGRWDPAALAAVVSYDQARAKGFAKLLIGEYDVLVLDEAHFLKNVKAKRTIAVFGKRAMGGGIASRAKRVWCLTGTPAPNNPAELYPVLRALFPDAIEGRNGRPLNYWQFVMRYCETYNNGFGIQIVGAKNSDELRARLRERSLRRTKAQVLKDLPPIRFDTLPVSGSIVGLPADEAGQVKRAIAAGGDLIASLRALAPHTATLQRLTGLAKVQGVVDWLEESGVEDAVIFAHHLDVIARLREELKYSVSLHGGTSPAQREAAVEAFQRGDARWFIGQRTAAGVGITLTRTNTLVFVEPSWVPAENEQAAMRIHRIGQERGCVAYFAMLPGSIDEAVMQAVARKTAMIRELGL